MKTLSIISIGCATAILTLATVDAADAATKKNVEKCYGVAKAGKNDCAAPSHSCAGQSPKDGDKNEWVYVNKGVCERLVNGKLTPATPKK